MKESCRTNECGVCVIYIYICWDIIEDTAVSLCIKIQYLYTSRCLLIHVFDTAVSLCINIQYLYTSRCILIHLLDVYWYTSKGIQLYWYRGIQLYQRLCLWYDRCILYMDTEVHSYIEVYSYIDTEVYRYCILIQRYTAVSTFMSQRYIKHTAHSSWIQLYTSVSIYNICIPLYQYSCIPLCSCIFLDPYTICTCRTKDIVFDTAVYICVRHRLWYDRCVHLYLRLCLTDTIQ